MTKEYVLVILAGLIRNYASQRLFDGNYNETLALRYAVSGSCFILKQAQTVSRTGITVHSMHLIAMVAIFRDELLDKVSQEFALNTMVLGLFALKESK